MKRVQLLVLALVAALAAGAAVKNSTPDFAFPQTVDKDGRRDLNAAIKADDAHAALNALIRVYIANDLIGEQGATQQSIELAESVAQKFAESPLEGMFYALMARMYNDEYAKQRWVYDERQMPLEPRPADITEWSGQQYKQVIKGLLDRSVANPSGLSSLRIGDYADIVEANKLTQIFYPTLYDFACSNAATIASWLDLTPNKYRNAGLANARERGSAPAEVLWQTVIIERQNYDQEWKQYLQYKNLYLNTKSNEYSALPLSEYADYYDLNLPQNFAECKWTIEQIDSLLACWPSAPLADKLKNQRQKLMQKEVRLSYRTQCMSGQTISIEVNNRNATDFTIEVFRLNGNTNRSISAKDFKGMQPMQSIKMACNDKAPFLTVDTVNITLKQQGYYAIIANYGEYEHNWVSPVRCVDVMPFSMSSESATWIAVVNPQTGAPIADASLKYIIKQSGQQRKFTISPSDSLGISDVSDLRDKLEGNWYDGTVEVTYGGHTNKFEDVDFHFPTKRTYEGMYGDVLTDRAIYHPGDSVHYLLIATEGNGHTKKIAKNIDINITLRNANDEDIDEVTIKTDEWGRAHGAFAIPTTGLTGRFSITCKADNDYISSTFFTVSDYRMPEFEIVDVKVARDVPAKGEATITGRAVYYSGMPMAGATITAELQECVWHWRPTPTGAILSSHAALTGENGEFSITFSSNELKSAQAYNVDVSAVSPSGSTATASPTTFSLGKQYVIDLEVDGSVDGEKPFTPTCQLSSYGGEAAKFNVKWAISTIDSTTVLNGTSLKNIDLSTLTPARYLLTVEPVDSALADAASSQFVVYNVSSGIVPETDVLIWIPSDKGISIPAGSQTEVLFGLTDSAYVYVSTDTDTDTENAFTGKWYAKGYHTLKLNAANGSVMLVSTKDFRIYRQKRLMRIEPEKHIKIIGETFRDRLIPGNTETWRMRIVDTDGHGFPAAIALDMYNRALDALDPHDFSFYIYTIPPFGPHLIDFPHFQYNNTDIFTSRLKTIKYEDLVKPEFSLWKYLTYSRGGVMRKKMFIRGASYAMDNSLQDELVILPETFNATAMSAGAITTESEIEKDDEASEETEEENGEMVDESIQPENIPMRDGDVPLAVWAPQLTTDAEGNVCYTFTVPNANASWRLYATAWTQNLRSANLTRDFVANKPLMVQPNAPRFMRAGDKADVAIALLNNTDSLASVQAVVELFDHATGTVIDTQTFDCDIDSMAQSTIFAHIEATSMQAAIGFRVKAFTSRFGDGEQLAIPVLPADASLIETTPFYLNPSDSTFTMTLPAQPDARISLSYCENPAWTIVSALPGLREDKAKYANSAAAVIFSAAIAQGIIHDNPEIAAAITAWQANPADSALVSMLEKNEDLKIAMLNATPWVQAAQSDSERMARLALLFDKKQTSRAIGDAIDVLQKLQRADGGWAWGDWCQQSSPWVTGRVLAMMADLKSYGWLPTDKRLDSMIKSALKYWDKEVEGPNVTYAVVRNRFTDVPVSTRGQQAITKTVNDILKHWKSYADPAGKAIAAQALYLNGYPTKSRELMSSITEFGVWSENQGLRFPSVNALSSYAAILKAYAIIEPGSRQVDGLRQQLIVRKQATDWGSSTVTSDVVAAILSCGTRWAVAAKGAEITAGGETIATTGPIETATGSLRADLSAHAGQTLTVTAPSAGPSYGAVYSQFSQAMADVKASACDDLSIEKTMMVRRGTEWAYVDGPLQVGDRVKVQLTIHTRRNIEYVAIIDERPAAFEPADQLPGWLWSQGAGFYRENRDAYTALHIVSIAPGTYQLTYEMNVNTAGTYSSGVATIQSQYAPELSAHSAGIAIQVRPQ